MGFVYNFSSNLKDNELRACGTYYNILPLYHKHKA